MTYDHDGQRGSTGQDHSGHGTSGVGPGKATLTQRLVVQRRAQPSSSEATETARLIDPRDAARVEQPTTAIDDPFGLHLVGAHALQRHAAASSGESFGTDAAGAHDIAARATAGSGGALPHLDTIQRAFGEHDVSGIRAHTDGAAADGARQLGAHAFASGNDVAFASPSPDLHTAAHEAAHVVQQRAGVHLKDGLGKTGDAYEQHADAVADAVVRGESAAHLLGPVSTATASPATQRRAVQRFSAAEHEEMGKAGSGGAMVELAEGYSISFGEVVALAGDHFSSIEQMRTFAANTEAGAGGRLEIEWARRWKLGRTDVPWNPIDPKYQEARKSQEKRYYVLAGGNERPYPGNASHFLNPREGDIDKTAGEKATDTKHRMDDRTFNGSEGQWVRMIAGVGAAANYRLNHSQALMDAAIAGGRGEDVASALAADAFACHYLTDSFASGHVRTPRLSAKEYWDAKVPMFYENLVEYMAQQIARYLRQHKADVKVPVELPLIDTPIPSPGNLYPDANRFSEDLIWDQAKGKVRRVFEAKARLTLGDIVSLAIHDSDNALGVMAHVDGKQTHLVGDGQVIGAAGGQRHVKPQGSDTMAAASRAVTVSIQDVHEAHRQGAAGSALLDILQSRFDEKAEMYPAEKLMPTLTPADLADSSNPQLRWKFDTWEDLLADPAMVDAIRRFLDDKASEIDNAGFEGAEQDAITDLGKEMRGDPRVVLSKVINWTPDSGGGLGGHNQDDNARDYYAKAKRTKGGLASLTPLQRINLIIDCINGAIGEDDEITIWGLLESATDDAARQVIDRIGWRNVAGYLDGKEHSRFVARFPEDRFGRP